MKPQEKTTFQFPTFQIKIKTFDTITDSLLYLFIYQLCDKDIKGQRSPKSMPRIGGFNLEWNYEM